ALSRLVSSPQRAPVGVHGPEPATACCSYAAYALWPLGYPDQALESARQAVARARGLAHPQSLCMALYLTAVTHQRRRAAQLTAGPAEELVTLAAEHGFPTWVALGAFPCGWAQAARGERGEGLAQLRRGLAALQATSAGFGRLRALTYLAAGLAEEGQTTEA